MPTISSTDKVLVTGANGYIGLWIVKTLLERGNSVRAAVRSERKGRHLQELFKSHAAQLEVVIVPDMTKEGAWDDAIQGCQGVTHLATSADWSDNHPDPEEVIGPAVKGTVRILESALKYKEGIKRVVITSSVAAVLSFADPSRTYSEEDWNETDLKATEERGSEVGVQRIYSASKVLAERAAWDFYKKHKHEIGWDMTTILPPLVIGAPLQEVSSPEALNVSLQIFWKNVLSDAPKTREALGTPSAWSDVRDLAESHVLALEKEKAGGERIFVIAGSFVWQDILDAAHKANIPGHNVSRGFPDISRESALKFPSTKATDILGMKFRSLEETVKHTLDDFDKRGFKF